MVATDWHAHHSTLNLWATCVKLPLLARHAEHDLTAARIATDLGMSGRSLQRLFEGDDHTVAEHIASSRLKHALTLLSDPWLAEVPLTYIATQAGFSSLSRMRRAVGAATGESPRAIHMRAHDDGSDRSDRISEWLPGSHSTRRART